MRTFFRRIEGRYPIREAIVFGSRARGTHGPNSDADLAIVLDLEEGDRRSLRGELAELAFDVLLETGVLVQALPLWENELRQPDRFGNPALIATIKREGIRL